MGARRAFFIALLTNFDRVGCCPMTTPKLQTTDKHILEVKYTQIDDPKKPKVNTDK
ncbi:hypothetical protein MNB_SV-4-758 [hydrothermal vent metagenome]|uniref:Uncharacterized protein n=1 Tax=hydrothermal vent metagenome TaxID=652676 RepID=A0A1W1E8Y0_9ZZZZ